MADVIPLIPVSPTGAPTLSQKLIKAAVPLLALTGAIAALPSVLKEAGMALPDLPWIHAVVTACTAITFLGVSLATASQGARKEAAVVAGAAAAASPGEALNK